MRDTALSSCIVGCVIAFALFVSTGCDRDSSTQPPDTVIRISGSGTCLPLLRVLSAEYEREHDVRFVYLPGLHSSGGIKGVVHGDLDIGAVSRALTDEERELGVEYVHLSDDGLAIAAHPSAEVAALTSDQVRGVYAGLYRNWVELGGADIPIVMLDRNEDESAKMILRQYVLGPMAVSEDAIVLAYEQDMIDALQKTPGGIGYFSLGFGLSEGIEVDYVSIDGVPPSIDAIVAGEYPMVRPLGVVVSPSAEREVKDFVAWTQSGDARELVREHGFAPPLDAIGE